jgi:hypothetical protein
MRSGHLRPRDRSGPLAEIGPGERYPVPVDHDRRGAHDRPHRGRDEQRERKGQQRHEGGDTERVVELAGGVEHAGQLLTGEREEA